MHNDQTGFTGLLTKEHHVLRRALDVLRAMTDRVEQGIPTDRHDVNAMLIFLHYFGDVLHQAKEESILFPALRTSDKFAESAELENLLVKHNEERGLIEKAQFALFTDPQDEFIASARRVLDLVSEHVEEEEHVLFPLAEVILTTANAIEVATKFQETDAVFGFRQRQLLMEMLHQLETKYIRKAA
jgi:hemerythrin-like domain-containing protein